MSQGLGTQVNQVLTATGLSKTVNSGAGIIQPPSLPMLMKSET
jgi:hypothetical protein